MTIRPKVSPSGQSSNVLKVERPYYEQEQFNNELSYCQRDDSNRGQSVFNRIRNVKTKDIFLSVFPLFSWLPQYDMKNNIVGDLVSGCTVAIMHIPQGKTVRIRVRQCNQTNSIRFMFSTTNRHGLCDARKYTAHNWHLHGIFSGSHLFCVWHIET